MAGWLTEFLPRLMHPLVLFGFAGQFVFMLRFVVQWYVSERRKRSTIPVIFWWISLLGGCMLCAYGVLDRDPVIMLGQGLGIAIYVRNLVLIYRRRARLRDRAAQLARHGETALLLGDCDATPTGSAVDEAPVPSSTSSTS